MSTIPKAVLDKIQDVAMCDYEDDQVNAFKDGAQYGYQLATDGREELEKEIAELKRDKVYWQLEAQAKHNANEQLRKELLKANNSYDEQFNQITALQSQCTEKDQEIERLKYLVERAFWAHDIIEFKEEHGL